MEMQRIDANTIRVLIDQDDLDARGITMLDLLGNQNQIEDFFYSILKEVDTEHLFHKNDSVTFQALPTKKGLELLITKSAPHMTENKQHVSKMISQELRGHDSSRNRSQSSARPAGMKNVQNFDPAKQFVFKFKDFEDFVELAQSISPDDYQSDLYLYHGKYYLLLQNVAGSGVPSDEVKDMLAIVNEFADESKMAATVLSEHGKRLMRQSALETAQYYFKN